MPAFATKLEPSSLYVATQTIPTADYQVFHWFLLATGADGSATTHQWVEENGGIGDTEEQYIRADAPTCTMNPSVIAYFRVKGYDPICADRRDSSDGNASDESSSEGGPLSVLEQTCSSALQHHFPTMRENRAHGLSCMTWVMSVLKKLERKGYITRPDNDITSGALEARIKSISAEQEELLMKTLMNSKRPVAKAFSL